MPTNFQEFLRQKTEGSDIKDRRRNRAEWLAALDRLYDQIRGWLHEADPEELIEIVTYEVERVERPLGVYDAPAMKLRLGTDSVDVRPVGRFSMGLLASQMINGHLKGGGPAAGRVDITNGERKHLLFREVEGEEDRWYAVDDHSRVEPFDRHRLEAILQDLMP
jgi:hypothetical protein